MFVVTDPELAFWLVCGFLTLCFFIALPFLRNYCRWLEAMEHFEIHETNHDDMEDRR